MELWVHDARPADAEALVSILNPIVGARVHRIRRAVGVEAERGYLLNFPPRGIWRVAIRRSDERLVGFQIMEPFAAYTGAFDHIGALGTYVDLELRHRASPRGSSKPHSTRLQEGIREDFRVPCAPTIRRRCRPLSWSGFVVIGTARKTHRIDGRCIDNLIEIPVPPV